MNGFKKFLVILFTLGLLAAIFAAGLVFFALALVLLPVVYFYQRYRMNNLWGEVLAAKKKQQEQNEFDAELNQSGGADKIIDGDYKVINEEKTK